MDKIFEKKVTTFKSGYFSFSRKYSVRELQPLRIEARVLYETVKDLPILPVLATDLEQDLIRRSIFGTAALEGNPLTEERVAEIIINSEIIQPEARAEIEIKNLKNTYDLLKTIDTFEAPPMIDEDLIKTVHKTITLGIEDNQNNPGQYRNHLVRVGDIQHGGVYTPPKILKDIEMLMSGFIEWINSEEILSLDKEIRAALAHYYLGLIHPFGDGNGRTARFIEALILRLSGLKYVPVMLSNYYYRNLDEYFWVFSKSIKSNSNDVTPFLKFVLAGFVESLKEIKERIVFYIRKFSLRDFYASLKENKTITQRQHDLLIVLLENNFPAFKLNDLYNLTTLNILYRQVSERTARRDLDKLKKMGLVKPTEDNKYITNMEVLG
jgi:Fic family protein